ncbi:DHS-like NAD/FAD-binding domain-containing protein [Tothia fuscella]|uniref:NAD-dependent protein deacylase n=1 Tax=Tothia fuscella TaxID=1048955 RepID=A0A9P4TXX9_9PEZI|nr:DHS-like NAD/FAD-binding domain-containing protein [Tothia fuscella]
MAPSASQSTFQLHTQTSSSTFAADTSSFHAHITKSTRILALLGAGLSASSGLPTFRGAGGLWREHDATELATPEAFDEDPGLVWQFYNWRRHMALKAQPNAAHYALAELARKMEGRGEGEGGFQTLSQNVDGLSQRAGHPRSTLHLLHGSLYDIKCTDFYCKYFQPDNFTNPIVPALHIDDSPSPPEDISSAHFPLPEVRLEDLPRCPSCGSGLLRPGVVWFGEMLPEKVMRAVENWITASEKIDLIMVIGTSSNVHPAAGYVSVARAKGARVAVINTDKRHLPDGGLREGDWFFVGDAAEVVPALLEPVIGYVDVAKMQEKETEPVEKEK